MPELNKANRQVCDVDIRELKSMAPFLFLDTANTTTAGLSGDSVFAMAKGRKAIAFHNPIEGTLTIEAQVLPFKAYALMSDGVIDTNAIIAKHEVLKGEASGKITIPADVVAGTVFVYKKGEYGNTPIAGSVAGTSFTATATQDIEVGVEYEVGYVVKKANGVKKVTFNNERMPKDYFVTMSTVDKDEEGLLTPFIITAYKCTPQRNFELSFSSEGDPVSVSIVFDLMEDKDGNVLDIVEDTSAAA